MSKHTPGPWSIDEHGRIVAPDGGQVSAVGLSQPLGYVARDHVGHANANLIAAAPEMLEALKHARRFLKTQDADTAFVDATIAKAEGRS